MSVVRPVALLALAPFLVAWSGGGDGAGTVDTGATSERVRVTAVFEMGDEIRAILNAPVADGEGIVHLRLRRNDIARSVPATEAEMVYREYGPDGRVRFQANEAISGAIWLDRTADGIWLSMAAGWQDPEAAQPHRRWRNVGVAVGSIGADTAGPQSAGRRGGSSSSVTVQSSGGCDGDDWDDDDDWHDDDWSDDDDWSSSESGGCEGDDLDSGSSSGDTGGGCEGDDLDSGSSGGDAASCEGDAVAAGQSHRRSPIIARLVNHLPWLLVLVGVRLARRRRPRL